MRILFVSYNYTVGASTFGFGNVQIYREEAPQDADDLNAITKVIEESLPKGAKATIMSWQWMGE